VIFPGDYKEFPFEEQNFVKMIFLLSQIMVSGPERVSDGYHPWVLFSGCQLLSMTLTSRSTASRTRDLKPYRSISETAIAFSHWNEPENQGLLQPDKDALSSHYPHQIQMIIHYK